MRGPSLTWRSGRLPGGGDTFTYRWQVALAKWGWGKSFLVEGMANVQTRWHDGSGVFREEEGRRGARDVGVRKEDEVRHEGAVGTIP